MSRQEKHIGTTYGRLTVVSYKGSPDFYNCVCSCGNTTVGKISIMDREFANGGIPSCGCSKIDLRRAELIGTKWGMLTVQKYVGGADVYVYECECGTILTKEHKRIREGIKKRHVPNCGCITKKQAKKTRTKKQAKKTRSGEGVTRINIPLDGVTEPPPCEKLGGCPHFKACIKEQMACEDFVAYLSGLPHGTGGNPSKELFKKI